MDGMEPDTGSLNLGAVHSVFPFTAPISAARATCYSTRPQPPPPNIKSNRRKVKLTVDEGGNYKYILPESYAKLPQLSAVQWHKDNADADAFKKNMQAQDQNERESKHNIESWFYEWLSSFEFEHVRSTEVRSTKPPTALERQQHTERERTFCETVVHKIMRATWESEAGGGGAHPYSELCLAVVMAVFRKVEDSLPDWKPLLSCIRNVVSNALYVNHNAEGDSGEWSSLTAAIKVLLNRKPHSVLLRDICKDNDLLMEELHATRKSCKSWSLLSWRNNVMGVNRRDKHLAALEKRLAGITRQAQLSSALEVWKRFVVLNKNRKALSQLLTFVEGEAPLNEKVHQLIHLITHQKDHIEDTDKEVDRQRYRILDLEQQILFANIEVKRVAETAAQRALDENRALIAEGEQLMKKFKSESAALHSSIEMYKQMAFLWERVSVRLLHTLTVKNGFQPNNWEKSEPPTPPWDLRQLVPPAILDHSDYVPPPAALAPALPLQKDKDTTGDDASVGEVRDVLPLEQLPAKHIQSGKTVLMHWMNCILKLHQSCSACDAAQAKSPRSPYGRVRKSESTVLREKADADERFGDEEGEEVAKTRLLHQSAATLRNLGVDLRDSVAMCRVLSYVILPHYFAVHSSQKDPDATESVLDFELQPKSIRELFARGEYPSPGIFFTLNSDPDVKEDSPFPYVMSVAMKPSFDELFGDIATMNLYQRATTLLYFASQVMNIPIPARPSDVVDNVEDVLFAFMSLVALKYMHLSHYIPFNMYVALKYLGGKDSVIYVPQFGSLFEFGLANGNSAVADAAPADVPAKRRRRKKGDPSRAASLVKVTRDDDSDEDEPPITPSAPLEGWANECVHKCRQLGQYCAELARRAAAFEREKFILGFVAVNYLYDRSCKSWKSVNLTQVANTAQDDIKWSRIEGLLAEPEPDGLAAASSFRAAPMPPPQPRAPQTSSKEQINKLNDTFTQYQSAVKKAYNYYAAAGTATERTAIGGTTKAALHMGKEEFYTFTKDIHVVPKGMSKSEVDAIFLQSNRSRQFGGGLANDVNIDHQMTLAEFMEAIVRVADGTFTDETSGKLSISQKLVKLFDEHIVPHSCPSELEFFRQGIQSDDVQRVLHANLGILKTIFRAYSTTLPDKTSIMLGPQFLRVLKEGGCVDQHFTNTNVQRIFLHCQQTEGIREHYEGGAITFVEFLAALAMVAAWKNPAPFIPLHQRVEHFVTRVLVPPIKMKLFVKTRRNVAISSGT